MAVSVKEVGSGLFAAALFHIGISIGFIPMIVLAREYKTVHRLRECGQWKKIFWLMVAAGATIAFLENGPSAIALESANASEVFALKRVMPFFALALGVSMFQETITRKHFFGTTLLVIGSIFVAWFR